MGSLCTHAGKERILFSSNIIPSTVMLESAMAFTNGSLELPPVSKTYTGTLCSRHRSRSENSIGRNDLSILCICELNSSTSSAYFVSNIISARSSVPRAFGLNSTLHVPSLNNLSFISRICAARSALIIAKSSSLLGSPVPGSIPHARRITGLKASSTALPATLDIQTDDDRRAYRLPRNSLIPERLETLRSPLCPLPRLLPSNTAAFRPHRYHHSSVPPVPSSSSSKSDAPAAIGSRTLASPANTNGSSAGSNSHTASMTVFARTVSSDSHSSCKVSATICARRIACDSTPSAHTLRSSPPTSVPRASEKHGIAYRRLMDLMSVSTNSSIGIPPLFRKSSSAR